MRTARAVTPVTPVLSGAIHIQITETFLGMLVGKEQRMATLTRRTILQAFAGAVLSATTTSQTHARGRARMVFVDTPQPAKKGKRKQFTRRTKNGSTTVIDNGNGTRTFIRRSATGKIFEIVTRRKPGSLI